MKLAYVTKKYVHNYCGATMDFIKKKYKFSFVFLICLVINVLFRDRFYDGLTQYGMAHAVVMGEIPYADFSMVTTPLFIFLHAIFLTIYDSFLTFTIVNSIISTMTFYYAERIIGKHIFTYFFLCLLPLFDVLCPSYNLLSKLLLMMIIYYEKEKKSDFSIGILLGLLILTKHSVGGCIFLCSLIYRRELKGIINRIKGVFIPCFIFLIHLLITQSLYEFIDLTILGLFDFGKKNALPSAFIMTIFVILLIVCIVNLIKGKKEHRYITYYALGSLSYMVPIFDLNHASCTLLFFYLLFLVIKEYPVHYMYINVVLFILLVLFGYKYYDIVYDHIYIHHFNHFPIYISESNNYEEVLDYYENKYPNSYMIDFDGVLYNLAAEKKITFLDIPLTGNYGYRGEKAIIEKLEKNKYYFISPSVFDYDFYQFDYDLCNYVIEHSQLVDTVSTYNIYYYKG